MGQWSQNIKFRVPRFVRPEQQQGGYNQPRAAKQQGGRNAMAKMPRAAKQLGGEAGRGKPSNNPAGNPGGGPCIPCWVAGLGTVTHHYTECENR